MANEWREERKRNWFCDLHYELVSVLKSPWHYAKVSCCSFFSLFLVIVFLFSFNIKIFLPHNVFQFLGITVIICWFFPPCIHIYTCVWCGVAVQVRAAAVFALGAFVYNGTEQTDHASSIELGVGMTIVQCASDGSPLVRKVRLSMPYLRTLPLPWRLFIVVSSDCSVVFHALWLPWINHTDWV